MSETVNTEQRHRKGALAVNLGLAANIFLAAAKTLVGILGHSPALLADGVNSTSDVAYYLVVAVFMRLARKPADETHPYGHSQLESISALLVGAFVISTAIAIFWGAVNNVFDLLSGVSSYAGAELLALWIALGTVAIKIILAVFTQQLYHQTNNAALLALAYDHRNDIYSAAGASVGIALGRLGLPWADPLVGALVALLVLRTGLGIVRKSSADLMDAVPSKALAKQIMHLMGDIPEVLAVEELHAHCFGPYLVVNITIGIDGEISVADGDCIASKVEYSIMTSVDLVRRVYVHYHPVQELNCLNEEVGKNHLPPLLTDLETSHPEAPRQIFTPSK
ncbi:MAG: cation transporter [Anaerolineales bacterium]|nr:cation transporter [Anaerolineales bacterium]